MYLVPHQPDKGKKPIIQGWTYWGWEGSAHPLALARWGIGGGGTVFKAEKYERHKYMLQ